MPLSYPLSLDYIQGSFVEKNSQLGIPKYIYNTILVPVNSDKLVNTISSCSG